MSLRRDWRQTNLSKTAPEAGKGHSKRKYIIGETAANSFLFDHKICVGGKQLEI